MWRLVLFLYKVHINNWLSSRRDLEKLLPVKRPSKKELLDRFNHPSFKDENLDISYSRVWFNLLRVQRRLVPLVLRVLKEENIKDPIWYEILEDVDKAGPQGLPMIELERKLHLPQYAVSRHVSRMEEAGFLTKSCFKDERRRNLIFVTDLAAGLHDRVWPKYFEAIKSEISGRLSQEEAYQLARLLIRLTY